MPQVTPQCAVLLLVAAGSCVAAAAALRPSRGAPTDDDAASAETGSAATLDDPPLEPPSDIEEEGEESAPECSYSPSDVHDSSASLRMEDTSREPSFVFPVEPLRPVIRRGSRRGRSGLSVRLKLEHNMEFSSSPSGRRRDLSRDISPAPCTPPSTPVTAACRLDGEHTLAGALWLALEHNGGAEADRIIAEAGGVPHGATVPRSGRTLLHVAAGLAPERAVLFETVAKALPTVDTQDAESGATALLLACSGPSEAVALGACRVYEQLAPHCFVVGDHAHRTPLHAAAESGRAAVVTAVLDALPDVVDRMGGSVQCCVDAPDVDGRTPLHCAALSGATDVVSTLLAAGADPCATDRNGATPLHYVCFRAMADAATELLGADRSLVAVADDEGRAPLHLALLSDRAGDRGAVVSVLLAFGADPTAADGVGVTALHTAAAVCDTVVMEALLQSCGHVDLRDKEGATPLHRAAASNTGACVAALLQHGADASKTWSGTTAVLLAAKVGPAAGNAVEALLQQAPMSACVVDDTHRAPLHYAAGSLCTQAVAALLVADPSGPSRADDEGRTPLHAAVAAACDGGDACSADGAAVIRALMRHGADAGFCDLSGASALDAAQAHPAVLQALAGPSRRSKKGR